MTTSVHGIHHVTCIAGDAQENLDFYVAIVGNALVKRSVNQDDPAPITCSTPTASESRHRLDLFPLATHGDGSFGHWINRRSFLCNSSRESGSTGRTDLNEQRGTGAPESALWGNYFSLQRCTWPAAGSRGNGRRTAICALGEQPGPFRTPVARHAFRTTLGAEA